MDEVSTVPTILPLITKMLPNEFVRNGMRGEIFPIYCFLTIFYWPLREKHMVLDGNRTRESSAEGRLSGYRNREYIFNVFYVYLM